MATPPPTPTSEREGGGSDYEKFIQKCSKMPLQTALLWALNTKTFSTNVVWVFFLPTSLWEKTKFIIHNGQYPSS